VVEVEALLAERAGSSSNRAAVEEEAKFEFRFTQDERELPRTFILLY
jgi:hypothetical protein